MDRQTALRKLRACLRMAASSNANEAATALRHAQKLMDDFGLTQADADDAELGDFGAPTRHSRGDLPQHLVRLINAIAAHFHCDGIAARGRTGMVEIRFVGPRASAEVAAYAFTVLRRQMERDIVRHCARIRKRANRTARGTVFGIGWVRAIRALLNIRELSIEEKGRIERHVAASMGETTTMPGRELAKKSWKEHDFYAGHVAGGKARLHAGVGGEAQRRLENQ